MMEAEFVGKGELFGARRLIFLRGALDVIRLLAEIFNRVTLLDCFSALNAAAIEFGSDPHSISSVPRERFPSAAFRAHLAAWVPILAEASLPTDSLKRQKMQSPHCRVFQ